MCLIRWLSILQYCLTNKNIHPTPRCNVTAIGFPRNTWQLPHVLKNDKTPKFGFLLLLLFSSQCSCPAHPSLILSNFTFSSLFPSSSLCLPFSQLFIILVISPIQSLFHLGQQQHPNYTTFYVFLENYLIFFLNVTHRRNSCH